MQALLSLIILVAFIAVIIGLIRPSWVLFFMPPEKRTRLIAFGMYSAIFVLCGILMPSTGPANQSDKEMIQLKDTAKQAEQAKVQQPKGQRQKASPEQIATARDYINSMYAQLMAFKDDPIFHEEGFGAGHPVACKWLIELDDFIRRTPFKKGYPLTLAVAPKYLRLLSSEYRRSQGKENTDTRNFKSYIAEGLIPPPAPVEAVAPTGPKESLGKWKSTWGYNHTLEIVRQGGAATIKNSYEDSSSGIEEYVAEDKAGQIKLTRVGDTFGEYYIINKRGELEYWSKTENYYIAPKID